MKKISILFLAFIVVTCAIAQDRKGEIKTLKRSIKVTKAEKIAKNIIWSSDFSDKSLWTINNDAGSGNYQNWKITAYPPAGPYSAGMRIIKSSTAENNFAIFDSDLMGSETAEHKGNITNTNPIDCSVYSKVYLEFQSYYANLDSKVSVKVTNDGGENWHEYQVHADILDWNVSSNPEVIRIDVSEFAAGQSEFHIRFYFDGLESDWGLAWMIDDVKIYEPEQLDADIVEIKNYWIMGSTEDFEMKAVMQNFGTDNINSVTFKYKVNDFESSVITLDDLSVEPFKQFTFTHPEKYAFNGTGNFTPSIEVLKINDIDFSINAIGDFIEVYNSENKKAIALELFTSSSCDPCANFNRFSDFVEMFVSPNLLNTTKYQMSWPGSGDPYYTQEGEVRRQLYEINTVPTILVNGDMIVMDDYGLNTVRQYVEQEALIEIELEASISGNTVNVDVDVTANSYVENINLLVSINEKLTHLNATTNGETDFSHVMMKMLPDGDGTLIENITANNTVSYSFSYDMTTTNMEEINDLEVVAFVQNPTTFEILQSRQTDLSFNVETGIGHESELKPISIYPNPANQYISILGIEEEATISIFDLTGKEVLTMNKIQNNKQIDISGFNTGLYIIRIASNKGFTTKKFIKFN